MRRMLQIVTSLAALMAPAGAWAEPQNGGVINVATIGEPPTLDPMASTADLVGMITQHIFETLYTFDANWGVVPLLAGSLPEISDDARTYTIPLQREVKFHDGSDLKSDDVVASLKRWMDISTRGKQIAERLEKLEAVDDYTVRITLTEPYAPLVSFLALNNSAAIIIPSEIAGEAQLTQPIGTGPYQLKEHKPDQYIQLARFEGYKSLEGEPNGYGGARKQYADEIVFTPVPDSSTRVEAAAAGQFDYVDSLPVEAHDRISGSASVPLVLKAASWPMFVMNTKEGIVANPGVRKAIQAALAPQDMLLAAFGTTDFFSVDGALYPEGYVWHTTAGTEKYRPEGDIETATSLLKEAGYNSEPIRILTSKQYEFHFKMAQVAAEYMKAAGMNVQLDVVDWATLTERRGHSDLWDIYITHSPFFPEPSLITVMSDNWGGWWATEEKHRVLKAFNGEVDAQKRVKLWEDVQKAFYDEVPAYKVGNFSALAAHKPTLKGIQQATWPYFWNAWSEKE